MSEPSRSRPSSEFRDASQYLRSISGVGGRCRAWPCRTWSAFRNRVGIPVGAWAARHAQ